LGSGYRAAGPMGAHIWAPEIHFIAGKWYVYFAAGASDKVWDIRIYVLENSSANPLEGEWIEKGQTTQQLPEGAVTVTGSPNTSRPRLILLHSTTRASSARDSGLKSEQWTRKWAQSLPAPERGQSPPEFGDGPRGESDHHL